MPGKRWTQDDQDSLVLQVRQGRKLSQIRVTYVSNILYAAHGAPSQVNLGNGLVETTTYNNRLQPCTVTAGTLMTLQFRYGAAHNPANCNVTNSDNNGNVIAQTISRQGMATIQQHYRYDEINRLAIATEGATPTGLDGCPVGASWCQDFGYDRFGNRAIIGALGPTLHTSTPTSLTQFDPATNRLLSLQTGDPLDDPGDPLDTPYDAAGNLVNHDVLGLLGYDANNKMTSFHNGDGSNPKSGQYFYDAQGNRVMRVSSDSGLTTTTTYVYDAFGKLAAEYSSQAPTGTAARFFRSTDHLGSTRLVTKADGTVADAGCRDFFPFGERIAAGVGSRSLACYGGMNGTEKFDQQFTAKERDTESGLDYFLARYYSSSLGRFTSVDPENAGALLSDPQSWNGYAYVTNRPLTLTDPDGRCPWCIPVIVGLYELYEAYSTAEDVVDTVKTVADPNASLGEKGTAVGLTAAGFFLPGSGKNYKRVGNAVEAGL